jgi:hypothetical protein
MDALIEKLMISKKIMDKHNEIPRGHANDMGISENARINIERPQVDDFEVPDVKYNIPQEYLSEQQVKPKAINSAVPVKDRILNSKLPDEIKKLMIEHPIQQPQAPTTTLSDELVEKASRLMGTKRQETTPNIQSKQVTSLPNKNELKSMMREVFEELLEENGLLIENTSKVNETIQFKVGKTIFEGKITKAKKIK